MLEQYQDYNYLEIDNKAKELKIKKSSGGFYRIKETLLIVN